MRGLTERQRKFALAYLRLANGTKAAIEAGYAHGSATVTGSQLIRNPNVLAFIEQNRIRRDVHADVTYANLINLADASLKILQEALNDVNLEFREKMMAYENARRCNETLAQVEGLTVKLPERKSDESRITLQALAQKLKVSVPGLPAPAATDAKNGSAA